MTSPLRQVGFTLLELVVALAVAAILTGIAVPGFVGVMQDSRLERLIGPTRRALLSARSEAVKGAVEVTVCPRASDTACGTDWNNGLLVFVDGTVVAGETTAVRDADDLVLSVIEPHGTANRLLVFASDDRTASGEYDAGFIRYRFDGRANWENGTLVACDTERGDEHSRALNVTLTGSVQNARPAADGEIVRDVFGREIDCS